MEESGITQDEFIKAEYTYESLKDRVHDHEERIKLLESCIKKAREYMSGTMFHTEGYTIRVYDMRFVSNMERILWEVDIDKKIQRGDKE